MRRYCVLVSCSALFGACDFAPERYEPFDDEPVAPAELEPPGPTYRYGVVRWEGLETDCPPDGAWVEEELGMAIVDGDTLTIVLETTPELDGVVIGGAAKVDGRIEFPGETGAIVDCVVAGSASLTVAEVAGALTERMSSVGDLNCTANARFRLVFDD